MIAGLQGWQLVIIVALLVLLFAAPKLPSMARSLGQSMRVFSSEVKQLKAESAAPAGSGSSAAPGPDPEPDAQGPTQREDTAQRENTAAGSPS